MFINKVTCYKNNTYNNIRKESTIPFQITISRVPNYQHIPCTKLSSLPAYQIINIFRVPNCHHFPRTKLTTYSVYCHHFPRTKLSTYSAYQIVIIFRVPNHHIPRTRLSPLPVSKLKTNIVLSLLVSFP